MERLRASLRISVSGGKVRASVRVPRTSIAAERRASPHRRLREASKSCRGGAGRDPARRGAPAGYKDQTGVAGSLSENI